MRILIAIPHFFDAAEAGSVNKSGRADAVDERLRGLMATVGTLHQTFGTNSYGLDHLNRMAWQAAPSVRHSLDVIICTTGDKHLLDRAPVLRPLYRHHATAATPQLLGFECHKLLRDALGRYDYVGFLEDDVVVTDPLFFRKRALFDRCFGPDALLQPNRYELRLDGPVKKLYVDYHVRAELTAPYQDIADHPMLRMPFLDETVAFERTTYPSAGCFFLNAAQLEQWIEGGRMLDGDISYLSALDSAATLSVMKQFRIYKPVLDQATFLEVLHASPRWIPSVESLVRIAPRDVPFSPTRRPAPHD